MVPRLVAATLAILALGGVPAPAAPASAEAAVYRMLLSSDRDGETRAYSMLPDGSRLTPLLPAGRGLAPAGRSRDGALVAYTNRDQALYVSRADGTGLRQLVPSEASYEGFSPDGRRLAFTRGGIWVVGADGRGLRRMTSGGDDGSVDWAPDGKSFVFARYAGGRYVIVVQPLQGRRRVLFRTSPDFAFSPSPTWSPDGRWIAYLVVEHDRRKNGLWVIRKDGKLRHRVAPGLEEDATAYFAWSPDGRWITDVEGGGDERLSGLWLVRPSGKGRHRLTPDFVEAFAWSHDGKRLAFVTSSDDAVVVRPDRSGSSRLRLPVTLTSALSWSPDGRRLAVSGFARDPVGEIWTFGSDLRGLRQVTSEGSNGLFGWTRLAPVLPAAPPLEPTERIVSADTVATRTPVTALAADGARVAFVARATPTDCDHVAVWTPGAGPIVGFGRPPAPCSSFPHRVVALALAGSRAAWAEQSEGTPCTYELETATLAEPGRLGLTDDEGVPCDLEDAYQLRGDGDLLVFDHGSRLLRIGAGHERCSEASFTAAACATLRQGEHAGPVDAVAGGLIAVREPGAVAVLDERGGLVRVFPFAPADVSAARLDGGRLVVWRFGVLEAYDLATGALVLSRPLPTGFRLADVDGGIAVLLSTDTIRLLRLEDGRSLSLNPGREPTLADLEPPGLYYSYATADGGGRVVFLPRSELVRQLGGSAR